MIDIHANISRNAYHSSLSPRGSMPPEMFRQARREDQRRLDAEFKKHALAHVGLSDHPKADKAFAMAWERGHSAGYNEVLNELDELAELLK